jgi:ribonuclease HIII
VSARGERPKKGAAVGTGPGQEQRRVTSYSVPLTPAQIDRLRGVLQEDGFEFLERPHTILAAAKGKVNVAVYQRGPKVLVQGAATADFVRFVLEPRVLGEARLDYEEVHRPEMFEPHAGVDESGKGDLFGPLVIAAVYTDGDSARELMSAGVRDSKTIGSEARIRELARRIRDITRGRFSIVSIGPERYNQLYDKIRNLNRLLGWGHARAIENLLEKVPGCPRVVSDQFADARLLERAVFARGRSIELQQRVRAEADAAVAAASILARERFLTWLADHSKEIGVTLPRGVSSAVKAAARDIVARHGAEKLRSLVKLHFRTVAEVAPGLAGESRPLSETP